MPFNGSGTFTRVMNWLGDASANIKIRADRHDQEDDNLAAGLSNVICKDGQTIVTADIPFNGHKLVNVGNPVDAQDAVTRGFLDSFGGWTTSKYISGADANGRLNFTSLTGANGITWSSIGAAWLARVGVTDKERNRIVLNNNVDGSGTDVIAIDEANGSMMFPSQFETSTNLIFDGTSWRTPVAGTGGIMRSTATALSLLANAVATTLAYGVAALETWFQVVRSGGTVIAILNKKADTDYAGIMGQKDGVLRWLMQLGNGTAEDASNAGSNFYLSSYTNAGASNFTVMWGDRKTGRMRFPQGLSGQVNVDAMVYYDGAGNGFYASKTLAILAGETGVRVYPRGYGDSSNNTIWGTDGLMTVSGYVKALGLWERSGSSGAFGTQVFNFLYSTSTDIRCYVGASFVGTITPVCDYRVKREVQPLPSTWEAVKALRPVHYTDAAFGDGEVFKEGDTVHWGFLAHELQEALLPSAATGEKDGEDLQAPNLMTVIAALTAALQEAEVRIEALEAKAA